ncbi:hydantoinase/oxoprolinase N-terminal domain-containing protein [Treponema primitia]|uniref:hydantoinase/oxoprolinase N-terminal domain-containing protein n=1 Tax=Treponema primitia TaxID=88058 RepID=UPI0002555758|nr:hydantoinase/oxoprolinase family protein [Treponema primitia]
MYRLGIDVGGTNTDAVLIDKDLKVIAEVKLPTSSDIHGGISAAIQGILKKSKVDAKQITKAMLGTTQCTNAIVERKHLASIGVLRIAAPATLSLRPMVDWAADLKMIAAEVTIIGGGFEHDGKEIASFDEKAARAFFERCKARGIKSVAISGVFSTVREDHELEAGRLCHEVMGEDVYVSLSSKIGTMGLIERENAAILNAALYKVSNIFIDGFTDSLIEQGVANAAVYFSQNDGTLMSAETARKYPILTIACGPTNSIRGASYLSKVNDAIIIDVGGTTTDIGILHNGFPRESSVAVTIGGVRTNFRMPDVVSFGLGGGSIIREKDGAVSIGPDSVGYAITEKALVFGGDVLTATDIAVRLGYAKIGDPSLVTHIDKAIADKAMAGIVEMVEEHIDAMKMSNEDADVILVGGGSVLLPEHLAGVKRLIKPDHFAVANAIGSGIAKISGAYEKLVSYDETPREQALEIARKEAIETAVQGGAIPETVEIIDVEDIPLQYYPGNTCRVKIKAAGELA